MLASLATGPSSDEETRRTTRPGRWIVLVDMGQANKEHTALSLYTYMELLEAPDSL